MALAGAGGGGFLYALAKEPDCRNKIQELIDASDLKMKIYGCQVSDEGIDLCLS